METAESPRKIGRPPRKGPPPKPLRLDLPVEQDARFRAFAKGEAVSLNKAMVHLMDKAGCPPQSL